MFSFLCEIFFFSAIIKKLLVRSFCILIVKKDVIHGTMEYGKFPFQSFGRFF